MSEEFFSVEIVDMSPEISTGKGVENVIRETAKLLKRIPQQSVDIHLEKLRLQQEEKRRSRDVLSPSQKKDNSKESETGDDRIEGSGMGAQVRCANGDWAWKSQFGG